MKKFFCLFVLILFALIDVKAQVVVNMEKVGGVYEVPCKINGVPMKFIFDTGASEVCMSLSEALFMFKNGYMDKSDLRGTTYSQIANGDVVKGTSVILKTVEIGGLELHNVRANIDNSLTAPLLLGQSAIQKLGSIRLEGSKLIIYNNSAANEGSSAFNDLFNKGVFAMNDHKYDEAIDYFKKSIQIKPNAYSYCNIGRCYMLKDDDRTALTFLQKAYSLDSQDPFTILNMAICYKALENYDVALDYLKMAIRLTTTLYGERISFKEGCLEVASQSYYLMGIIYKEKGQTLNAKGAFESLKKLDPTNARADFELAEMSLSNQEFDKAYDGYLSAINKNNSNIDNAVAYYKLGLINLNYKNDSKAALEMFERCSKFVVNNLQNGAIKYAYHQLMSELYMARIYVSSDPIKAIKKYESVISVR